MVLEPKKRYTFSEIFELKAPIDQILSDLGYGYQSRKLSLARYPLDRDLIQQFQAKLYRRLPNIKFTSETARREFIISDILAELIEYIELQIEVEYGTTTPRLRGNIDYLVHGKQQVIVLEAKNDEMERGFSQLAVEMIATADTLSLDYLYGAVTTGDFWRFGLLDKAEKMIARDLDSFSVPTGLHSLMETLAWLASTPSEETIALSI